MAQRPFPHPYLAGDRFAAFAHRGGGLENPENSRRAFAAAAAMGYRYIETDVQATADGVVLVFHDDDLAPLTNGEGVIATLPYSEVRQVQIGGTEALMTLEEALVSFPEIRFNIDIKTDHALEPTLDLLTRMDALDRVCLASFSDDRLFRIRKRLGHTVCTGGGPRDIAALKFSSWGLRLLQSSCQCAQVPVRQYGITIPTRRFIAHCHERGVAVHVWTIDAAEEMRRLIRLGVDGIMSDRPSLLREIAKQESVW
ncbi:MAG: glycerophosphodiester phosphodiesterase family protein [Pseudomonadota bacterium]